MHNISKGRIGEYLAVSKFLDEGCDVYLDFVDIRGVDFIVLPRIKNADPIMVQVKSTNSEKKAFRIPKKDPEADYFFLINTANQEFWTIPTNRYDDIKEAAQISSTIKDMMFSPFEASQWEQYKNFGPLESVVEDPEVEFHASRKGKMGEALGIGYLLQQGVTVFDSLVDVSGVDLVIRHADRYYDVQIKYSSKRPQYRNVKKREPKENYLFLFVREGEPREFYLMPSKKVWSLANNSGGIYLRKELRKKYAGISCLRE